MTEDYTLRSITFPKVEGGIVTRMTVTPSTGAITEINIETPNDHVEFPDKCMVDLNCKINIQRIITVGGKNE